jgi:hypothetical protein
MKGVIKLTILTLLCVSILTGAVGIAMAEPTPTPTPNAVVGQIITTDNAGSSTLMTQFQPGQTIYVKYKIDYGLTANIVVCDGAYHVIPGTAHLGATGSGYFTLEHVTPGRYYVVVNGAPTFPIAVASFFVVPEVLGSVAALGAGLAAFGIVKFKYKKI